MRRAVCLAFLLAVFGLVAPAPAARAIAFPTAYPMSDELLEAGTAEPLATTSYAYGYQPSDIRSAYAIPPGGKGRIVAVVAAYDHPNIEADLAVYRSRFGINPCTTGNGCFRKVNQRGTTAGYPAPDPEWAGEIALDLDMVSAVCPTCRILLVEADSANIDDLAYSVDTAARLGAVAITNSWGSVEFPDETWFQSHWNHPGVAITASTGDNGYGVSFPAASSNVIAVGGTRLVRAPSTARGWAESAWPGAGSGCSAYVAKPYWQKDTGCAKRSVADVAVVGDPATGVAVYNSYGSSGGQNWYVIGGTSAGAPIIAALFAVAGNTSVAYTGRYIMRHASGLWDITYGTNGACSGALLYLCRAGVGYDGPTGYGAPRGIAAF